MKKLLFVSLALTLNACVAPPLVSNTAYRNDVVPAYNNPSRYQQLYNNRNYQQPAPEKHHHKHKHNNNPNYQQPAYNNYEHHEHHDNGKHKGQHKHHDD